MRPNEYPIVHEEDTAGAYEFDIVMLIETEPNVFYIGRDTGCSCPIPFEDQTVTEDFVRMFSTRDVERYLDGLSGGSYRDDHNVAAFVKAMKARVAARKATR